jgi:predicted ATP-grasp superfamily ATP-dependent carboligase
MKQNIWAKAHDRGESSAARELRVTRTPLVASVRRARALIIDKRAVMGTEICRSLGGKGFEVDVMGEGTSPAFHSRYCNRRIVTPPFENRGLFVRTLSDTLRGSRYDAIFVCNEEVLEVVMGLSDFEKLSGLLHPARESLKTALSKYAMVRLALTAGIPTPRTFIVRRESDLGPIARELGFPLIVKGDRGEAGNHVRLVRDLSGLLTAFDEIGGLERGSGKLPALQEFVRGAAYSVGGLFLEGRPLRVCAHRKLVAVPPLGGLTVRGVTERPSGLLEAAFKVFEALRYTGLGHVELIKDSQGCFRFLEINPRPWGTIGTAEPAGVDFFTPYCELARGLKVKPDLRFREGVGFHRIMREAKMISRSPGRIFGFFRDCVDPRVESDFKWLDPGPHVTALLTRGLRTATAVPALGAMGRSISAVARP